LKDWMLAFNAIEKCYGRDAAFEFAAKSTEPMLKLVAVASADQDAAQALMHDLRTLRDRKDGTPEHNALRWDAA
jgi:hypothetical protein